MASREEIHEAGKKAYRHYLVLKESTKVTERKNALKILMELLEGEPACVFLDSRTDKVIWERQWRYRPLHRAGSEDDGDEARVTWSHILNRLAKSLVDEAIKLKDGKIKTVDDGTRTALGRALRRAEAAPTRPGGCLDPSKLSSRGLFDSLVTVLVDLSRSDPSDPVLSEVLNVLLNKHLLAGPETLAEIDEARARVLIDAHKDILCMYLSKPAPHRAPTQLAPTAPAVGLEKTRFLIENLGLIAKNFPREARPLDERCAAKVCHGYLGPRMCSLPLHLASALVAAAHVSDEGGTVDRLYAQAVAWLLIRHGRDLPSARLEDFPLRPDSPPDLTLPSIVRELVLPRCERLLKGLAQKGDVRMRDSLLMAVRAVTAMAGDSAELYDAWIGELYELVRAHVLNLRDAARGGGAGVLPPWEASSVEGRCLVGQKMFGAVDTAAHLLLVKLRAGGDPPTDAPSDDDAEGAEDSEERAGGAGAGARPRPAKRVRVDDGSAAEVAAEVAQHPAVWAPPVCHMLSARGALVPPAFAHALLDRLAERLAGTPPQALLSAAPSAPGPRSPAPRSFPGLPSLVWSLRMAAALARLPGARAPQHTPQWERACEGLSRLLTFLSAPQSLPPGGSDRLLQLQAVEEAAGLLAAMTRRRLSSRAATTLSQVWATHAFQGQLQQQTAGGGGGAADRGVPGAGAASSTAGFLFDRSASGAGPSSLRPQLTTAASRSPHLHPVPWITRPGFLEALAVFYGGELSEGRSGKTPLRCAAVAALLAAVLPVASAGAPAPPAAGPGVGARAKHSAAATAHVAPALDLACPATLALAEAASSALLGLAVRLPESFLPPRPWMPSIADSGEWRECAAGLQGLDPVEWASLEDGAEPTDPERILAAIRAESLLSPSSPLLHDPSPEALFVIATWPSLQEGRQGSPSGARGGPAEEAGEPEEAQAMEPGPQLIPGLALVLTTVYRVARVLFYRPKAAAADTIQRRPGGADSAEPGTPLDHARPPRDVTPPPDSGTPSTSGHHAAAPDLHAGLRSALHGLDGVLVRALRRGLEDGWRAWTPAHRAALEALANNMARAVREQGPRRSHRTAFEHLEQLVEYFTTELQEGSRRAFSAFLDQVARVPKQGQGPGAGAADDDMDFDFEGPKTIADRRAGAGAAGGAPLMTQAAGGGVAATTTGAAALLAVGGGGAVSGAAMMLQHVDMMILAQLQLLMAMTPAMPHSCLSLVNMIRDWTDAAIAGRKAPIPLMTVTAEAFFQIQIATVVLGLGTGRVESGSKRGQDGRDPDYTMRVLGSNCFRMAFESGLAWFLHQFESPSLSRTLSFVGTAMDAALGLAALAVTEDVVLKETEALELLDPSLTLAAENSPARLLGRPGLAQLVLTLFRAVAGDLGEDLGHTCLLSSALGGRFCRLFALASTNHVLGGEVADEVGPGFIARFVGSAAYAVRKEAGRALATIFGAAVPSWVSLIFAHACKGLCLDEHSLQIRATAPPSVVPTTALALTCIAARCPSLEAQCVAALLALAADRARADLAPCLRALLHALAAARGYPSPLQYLRVLRAPLFSAWYLQASLTIDDLQRAHRALLHPGVRFHALCDALRPALVPYAALAGDHAGLDLLAAHLAGLPEADLPAILGLVVPLDEKYRAIFEPEGPDVDAGAMQVDGDRPKANANDLEAQGELAGTGSRGRHWRALLQMVHRGADTLMRPPLKIAPEVLQGPAALASLPFMLLLAGPGRSEGAAATLDLPPPLLPHDELAGFIAAPMDDLLDEALEGPRARECLLFVHRELTACRDPSHRAGALNQLRTLAAVLGPRLFSPGLLPYFFHIVQEQVRADDTTRREACALLSDFIARLFNPPPRLPGARGGVQIDAQYSIVASLGACLKPLVSCLVEVLEDDARSAVPEAALMPGNKAALGLLRQITVGIQGPLAVQLDPVLRNLDPFPPGPLFDGVRKQQDWEAAPAGALLNRLEALLQRRGTGRVRGASLGRVLETLRVRAVDLIARGEVATPASPAPGDDQDPILDLSRLQQCCLRLTALLQAEGVSSVSEAGAGGLESVLGSLLALTGPVDPGAVALTSDPAEFEPPPVPGPSGRGAAGRGTGSAGSNAPVRGRRGRSAGGSGGISQGGSIGGSSRGGSTRSRRAGAASSVLTFGYAWLPEALGILADCLLDADVAVIEEAMRALQALLRTDEGREAFMGLPEATQSGCEGLWDASEDPVPDSKIPRVRLPTAPGPTGRTVDAAATWHASGRSVDAWSCGAADALLNCCEDPYLSACRGVAARKPQLAMLLLPEILSCIALADSREDAPRDAQLQADHVRRQLSSLWATWVFRPAAREGSVHPGIVRLCLLCLQALKDIHLNAMQREGMPLKPYNTRDPSDYRFATQLGWARIFWLELDSLEVARAALAVPSTFTALQMIEQHMELTTGRGALPPRGKDPELDALLLEAYRRVNDPDVLTAVVREPELEGLSLLWRRDGQWDHALISSDLMGRRGALLEGLRHLGSRTLLAATLQRECDARARGSRGPAADSDAIFEAAWRMGDWDAASLQPLLQEALLERAASANDPAAGLSVSAASAAVRKGDHGVHAALCAGLRALARGDRATAARAAEVARTREVRALASGFLESAAGINEALVRLRMAHRLEESIVPRRIGLGVASRRILISAADEGAGVPALTREGELDPLAMTCLVQGWGWESAVESAGPSATFDLLEPLIGFELSLKKAIRTAMERKAGRSDRDRGGFAFFPSSANASAAHPGDLGPDLSLPALHLALSRLAREAAKPMVAWGALEDLANALAALDTPQAQGGGVSAPPGRGRLSESPALLSEGARDPGRGAPLVQLLTREALLEKARVLSALKSVALAVDVANGVVESLTAQHLTGRGPLRSEDFALQVRAESLACDLAAAAQQEDTLKLLRGRLKALGRQCVAAGAAGGPRDPAAVAPPPATAVAAGGPGTDTSPALPSPLKASVFLQIARFADQIFQRLDAQVRSNDWKVAAAVTDKKQQLYDESLREMRALRAFMDAGKRLSEADTHRYHHLSKTMHDLERVMMNDKAARQEVLATRQAMMREAAAFYGRAVEVAGDREVEAVFRLCQLWFEYGAGDERSAPLLSREGVDKGAAELSKAIRGTIQTAPLHAFLPLVYQLASRISVAARLPLKAERDFQMLLQTLLVRLGDLHPHHVLPTLLALEYSGQPDEPPPPGINQDKVEAARAVLARIEKEAPRRGGALVGPTRKVFAVYQELAGWDDEAVKENKKRKDKRQEPVPLPDKVQMPGRIRRKIDDEIAARVPVLSAAIPVDPTGQYDPLVLGLPLLQGFEPEIKFVGGVNRPKVIKVHASTGVQKIELVKAGNDDLRQDAVMMQIFDLCNRLLARDAESRRRRLAIRTYKVVPFSPIAGLLEWVENTMPLGDWLLGPCRLKGAHLRYKRPQDYDMAHAYRVVDGAHKAIEAAQQKKALDEVETLRDQLVGAFVGVQERFPPVMRHFFTENHRDPASWFAARTAYTRSAAAASMVGHIVGLGDRHSQNILIDLKTGELIHIDLGIAFDQGQLLRTPELVPFRLTLDIEDGMGPLGVEGAFVGSCEAALRVMRAHRDALLTVVGVFLHDPLLNWALTQGRANRKQKAVGGAGRGGPGDAAPRIEDEDEDEEEEERAAEGRAGAGGAAGVDIGNADAERTLLRVRQKLEGVTDASAPPLAPEGQVRSLIQRARDPELLCRMYVGWAAWV